MAHLRSSSTASRWLAFSGVLALAASALAPAASAQTVDPSPVPKAVPVLASPSAEIYPRLTTEVDIGGGLRVKPLKTTTLLSGKQAVADRLIVAFAKDYAESEQTEVHTKAGARGGMSAKPVKQLGARTQLIDVSGAKSLEVAINAYRGDARVRLAAADLLMHSDETPNDPSVGNQWGLAKIQAPAAWNRTHGSTARRIAILDSGIDETNTDLAGQVVARRDFSGSAFGSADMVGHGTHVAGIAGALTNNNIGVAGVAFNTRLLNGKVIDDTGSGSISMLIDGIRWAVANGAEVINMSLGGEEDCNPSAWEDLFDFGRNELQDAIGEAWAANVVLVASAGNDGDSSQQWPGSCPNVLSVANTTSTDAKAADSNFGTWVDLAAPGSGILSTALPGGFKCANGTRFASCSGTSMAAPHVAGLAALVRTSCGFTTAGYIVSRINNTADQIAGTGTNWQFGRIIALRAVCFPPPTNLHLGNVTTNSIEILWNDGGAPADSSTEVHFRPHNAANWTVQVLAANRTSWLHQGLSFGAGYDYKVRDCDANGCSAFTTTLTGFIGGGSTLTAHVIGRGGIASTPAGINCPTDCSEAYSNGTVVTLDAYAYASSIEEWFFMGWTGACTGQSETCTVTMNAAKSVTARFTKLSDSPVGN